MDCRKCWWLAAVFACGALGCFRPNARPLLGRQGPDKVDQALSLANNKGATRTSPYASAHGATAMEAPPTRPTPATFVTLGDLKAQMVNDPGLPPGQREPLIAQAREAYQKALDLDPKCMAAQLGLARVASLAGEHEKALAEFARLTAAHPAQAMVWADAAMAHARARDLDASALAWQKAYELEPANKGFAKGAGLTLARAGRYEEALNWLARSGPADEAHYYLGRMLYQLRQDAAAVQQMARAVQLNPNNQQARDLLTAWQEETGAEVVPASATAPAPGAVSMAPAEPVAIYRASSHERPADDIWPAARAVAPAVVTSGWDAVPAPRPGVVRVTGPAAAPVAVVTDEPLPISIGFVSGDEE